MKFYYYLSVVFYWAGSRLLWVSEWSNERREALAWKYWINHPEEYAEIEKIAEEVAKDMNLRERLGFKD